MPPLRLRPAPLAALLLALVVAPAGAQPTAADSAPVYASAALQALVAGAARGNLLPPDLVAYRARVETEIAIAARQDEGTEVVVALEQVATTLRWARTGYYDQHVVGYRAQQMGLNISMIGSARTGWAVPTLYGNRLRLRTAPARARVGRPQRRESPTDTLPVVHPLADDRDAYYRYTGGDTIVTLRTGDRAIPIVRVRVEPRPDLVRRAGLFRGELELDAVRHNVVRLRGHYLVAPPDNSVGARLRRAAMAGYAFVEYVNAERDGRWWLPAYQRVDLQAASATLGETRGVVHIVSRFTDYAINDTTIAPADLARADSLRAVAARRLTLAPADSLARWEDWARPIGAATAETHGDDFLDVAPDRWQPTGRPRLELAPQRGAELFHFNRVEGAFTGVAGRLRFRDAAPGVSLRGALGWAWAEETARGRVELERLVGGTAGGEPGGSAGVGGRAGGGPPRWTFVARAGRSLDLTNDFRLPFDSGSTIAALVFSRDDYDYVDRRFASAAVTRRFGARAALLRVEAGAGSDRGVAVHVTRGLVKRDSTFRPNRAVDPGNYARLAATLELRPDVSGDFLRSGLGARLHWEGGLGELEWQRVEARVAGRRAWTPRAWGGATLVAAARADAGALLADTPPRQQLFELGNEQNLVGYAYKEFAGDRAAIARGTIMLISSWWRAPLRLSRAVLLPGLQPGVSIGLQGGWADVSDAAARRAVTTLDPWVRRIAPGTFVDGARPTDGVRGSAVAGLRLFGGSTLVGAARAFEREARWRFVLNFAQGL